MAVALGVVRDPSPQVLAGLLHRELRLPLQLLVRPRRVGRQVQHVALPAALDLVGEVLADHLAEGVDDLEDGAPAAGAEVPRLHARLIIPQVVQGDQVTFGQVDDVDVVADSRAVSGGIVCWPGALEIQLLVIKYKKI